MWDLCSIRTSPATAKKREPARVSGAGAAVKCILRFACCFANLDLVTSTCDAGTCDSLTELMHA